ncbi:unnamed protein product [Paramecium sonneborni]|uniref:NACHT domain-containing protein n=1 Tax=Paramecium sonneborni TaxID=65129 RepID=A0A8S1R0E3_9CILI|nr:unnamed protein product [Paramecium sonneborni]
MNQKYVSNLEISFDRENMSVVSKILIVKPLNQTFNYFTEIKNKRATQQSFIHLRGGGCGQAKPTQKIEEKIIIGVPDNFLKNLEKYVDVINTKAQLLTDNSQRNEVIIACQWFMYNKEHLNMCCINNNLTQSIYTIMQNSFGNLLKILSVYLRASWFLCYQILQICNDFLRVIYSFQIQSQERYMDLQIQQQFLQDLEEFKEQLEIEEANVWNTGIEYEVTLMKIMLINCQTNSEEGKNLLINIIKNVAESALQMSPTEDLIPSLIEGAKFLFLQYKDKVLYPQEVYATYYLFQTLKWSIVRQLKSQYSVYNQIKQLKDAFQQYILHSDNWIIHYSWISMIVDILAYRPIIDKQKIAKGNQIEQQSMWNNLIENNLIFSLTYNRNQASIILFQNQVQYFSVEIKDLMEKQGIPKFKLISDFILKGQFTQQINIWNFYRDFSFKKKKETTIKDFEIVLDNNDLLLLEKQIEKFNSQLDDLVILYQQIQQSLTDYFNQSTNTQINIKLLQNDYSVFEKQFLDAYKLALYHLDFIIERSTLEFEKLKLLSPCFEELTIEAKQKQNLENIFNHLEELIQNKFQTLLEDFLKNFITVVEYLSYLAEISLNPQSKKYTDLERVNSKFQIQNYLNSQIFFEQSLIIQQFIIKTKEFQQKFAFSMSSIKTNDYNIQITSDQIQAMSNTQCSGKWIKILRYQLSAFFSEKFNICQAEVKSKEDIQQIQIKCIFSLIILKLIKQFCQIHQYKINTFEQDINQEKLQAVQKQEQFNQNFKLMIIKQLKQQKEKIECIFLKQKDVDQTSKQSREKTKQLLYQIKLDQIMIENAYEKIEREDIYQIKSQVIQFMKEAHLFITIQNLNEHYEHDAVKSQMQQYDNIITLIQNSSFGEFNNCQFQEKTKTLSYWIGQNKNLDYCYFCVDQDIKEIKKTIKLLKILEQLLAINVNQIQQTENKELQLIIDKFNSQRQQIVNKFNIQTQITNLMKILYERNQSESCKCVVQIEQQKDKSIQKIESTLEETLNFFLFRQKSQENISQKLDPLYFNVRNNLHEQVTIKKSIFDVFDFSNDYKIRECLVYNLIKLQQGIKEEQIEEFSSKLIQYLWIFEKDQRVRNLLKNKELIEMQKLFFSKDIKSISEQVRQEMKLRMKSIESIQQELRLEGNSQVKEQIKQQLILAYEELEQYNDNITEMSEKMDVSLIILKDISKDVKQMKSQIDSLQESLNQVGDDIRKLRGKRYDELLDIRKQKILLQSKLAELDSVYVQLKTIEYDPVTGEIIKSKDGVIITQLMSEQQDDYGGEVNEFIWGVSKQNDVMLLSGNAGSGKSRAARKIEEFLWKQQGSNSKWIPIFVSLPTLKNPKYNLFEQALESENYQFDKYQVRELKEAIQNKKEFIILILDSYDEMKQDCIQQNLIITNKLIQDLNIEQNSKSFKIIITTRREILNTLGYQTWFYGQSIRSLKEVQIQDFDKGQKSDYLIQYNELSVRRKIRGVYDFLKQISQQSFNLDEFLSIWYQVNAEVQESIKNSHQAQLELIFDNSQIEKLIQKILEHHPFKYLKDEQIRGLRKDLSSLWSVYKFEKAIENVGISDLLSTPFMLEIIVQVLPSMAKQQQGSVDIKNRFLQSYISITNKNILSKKLLENYKNNLDQKENNQKIQPLFEGKRSKIQYYEFIDKSEQQTKIYQFLDELESLQFFQTYSITSILKIDYYDLFVDNKSFKIYNQDLVCVVEALKMKKYTIFEFYDSFIHFYHDQQIQKLREIGKLSNWESFQLDILQFSQNLALNMTINQLSQITYQQKGKLKLTNNYNNNKHKDDDDWIDEYFNDSQQDLDYNKLIRSCILLNAKGSSYSFTHKSIQEFYVAKYILDLLLQSVNQDLNENNLDEKQIMKSLYNQSKLNISKDHYQGALVFIKDKLNNLENIKDILINIVKLSTNDNFIHAASNSIYLLSQLDVYLGEEKFLNINICHTNISGLSFCNSDFSESKFTNVNINSCNFNYANLTNVKWNDIQCKEKPFLKKDEKIQVVEFSPNGKLIASNGKLNLVILWDVETYLEILELDGHSDMIQSIAFSPDSETLASASKDKTIKLWDISNLKIKKLITTLKYHDSEVIDVRFTYDGKKIVSADTSGILISCDLKSIKEKPDDIIFEYQQEILVQTCTQDDKMIALGLNDSSIKLIKVETKHERNLIGHTGTITALAFSKDGKRLASACNYLLLLWDLRNDNKCQILSFQEYEIQYLTILNEREIVIGALNYLAYGEFQYDDSTYFTNIQQSYLVQLFPKSNLAFIIQDRKIEILDLNTKAIINSIFLSEEIIEIELDNNEQRLKIRLKDYHKIFLNMNTFQEFDPSEREQRQFHYQNLVFEKCSSEIIIYDDKNQNYDESNNSIRLFCEQVIQFSFQANQQLLACKSKESRIMLYDYKEKKRIYNGIEDIGKVDQMVFSPIKPILSVIDYQGILYFWNISKDPFECQKFDEIDEGIKVYLINYSPDGSLLIISTNDQKIRIIDEINGSATKILEFQFNIDRGIYVSFDNETLVINSDKLWNLNKCEEILLQDRDSYYHNPQIQFCPDGISFALISQDKYLRLWNKNTGQSIKNYKLPEDSSYNSFNFSKDGKFFVTAGKYIRIWKYSENNIEMISAYHPYISYYRYEAEISQLLLIDNDQNLMYIMNKELEIMALSKCNLKYIIPTSYWFVQFLTNGYMVTQGYTDVAIFDWKQQISILTFRADIVEFFSDSLHCIIINQSRIIKMDMNSQKEIFNLVICEEIQSAELSQNEKILILICKNIIKLLNIEDTSNIYEFRSYNNTDSKYFSWSCNNDYLCYRPNSDFVIRQIQIQQKIKFAILDNKVLQINSFDSQNKILLRNQSGSGIFNFLTQKFELFKQEFKQSSISFNGQLIAYKNTEFNNNKFEFYDVLKDKSLTVYYDNYTYPIQFSKNGDYLCAYKKDQKQVIIFSIDEKKQLKMLCSLQFGSECKKVSVTPYFGYIAVMYSEKLKLMNLNWILKSQMVIINELKKGNAYHRNSFLLSDDNSIIFATSEAIKTYRLDLRDDLNTYTSFYGIITCFVQIDKNTICIGQKNQIYLLNISQERYNCEKKTPLGEHENDITSLIYSQKAQLLASSEDQKIFLWNINAKKKIAVFEGHTSVINQLSFSSDGKCLASASDDKQIKLWNIELSEQQKISKGHQKRVSQIAFSRDGLIIASSSDDQSIILWDLIDKNFIIQLEEHTSQIKCLQFSCCSQWLASGSYDESICLWDVKFPHEATLYYKIQEMYLNPDELHFSPSGSFTTLTNDKGEQNKNKNNQEENVKVHKFQVWNMNEIGKQEYKFELSSFYNNNLIFIQDNNIIFFGDETLIQVHDLSNKQNENLVGHSHVVVMIKSWKYGEKLLSVDRQNNVIFWQKINNTWIIQSKISLNYFIIQIDIIWNYYQDYIVCMNSDLIMISKLDQMQVQKPSIDIKYSMYIACSYLSNSENFFIFLNYDYEITLLNSVTGEIQNTFKNPYHQTETAQIKISNDDRFLAVSNKYSIYVFEISEKLEKEIPNLESSIQHFEFSWDDSNILYTVSEYSIIKKCDIKNNSSEIIRVIESLNPYCKISFNFSQQCNFIVYSQNNSPLNIVNLNDKDNYQILDLNGLATTFSFKEILMATFTQDYKIYLLNLKEEIYKENNINIIYKKQIVNLTFTNDDTELICCLKDSICFFQIQEDLQIKLKYIWKINDQKFYTFCPKHSSIFQVQGNENQIEFIQPVQTQLLIDEQHNPVNFHIPYDKNFIASISKQGIIIWDFKEEKQILNTSQWCGNQVMLIELKTLIIKCDKEIKILDIRNLETIQEIHSIQFNKYINSFSFSSRQAYFVCGFDTQIKVWKVLDDGQCQQVAIYDKKNEYNSVLAISPFGDFLVYKQEKKLQLVRIKQSHTKELDEKVSGLQYSSDYKYFITLINGNPQLFTSTLDQIEIQLENSLENINGQCIKSASIDSIFAILCEACVLIVKIIDNKKLTLFKNIQLEKIQNIISFEINPLGTLLIAGNKVGSIFLWDLTSSNNQIIDKPNLVVENQNHQIYDFKFSPNGIDISAAVQDGSINLYSVEQISNDQIIKQSDEKQEVQEKNQVAVIENINKQYRLICYKSFARQSLLLANQCIVLNAQINQNTKSILQLFKQKGAI